MNDGAHFSFRALAIDYDGTLGTNDLPDAEALAAIDEARRRGLHAILVTGRIMTELRAVFPDVSDWFDAVVAENGAVMDGPVGHTLLAPPVDSRLAAALAARGVECRSGEVLLACRADDGSTVLEELHRLGLDCHLLYNRAELMVLPVGVTKGTGLRDALRHLGLSPHSTAAIGDAENDLALFGECALGVAVANAVPSVLRAADVVTTAPAGAGVAELLRGGLLRGERLDRAGGAHVVLGVSDQGATIAVPGSRCNMLVIGTSGSGKSYVAGLVAERLVGAGYTVLTIDYEGDHEGLTALPGVVRVGGVDRLPVAEHVASLLRQGVSVVVDMSTMHRRDQDLYVSGLMPTVEATQRASGRPDWIVVDEAHRCAADVARLVTTTERSCCVVTWRPDLLPEVGDAFDHTIFVASSGGLSLEIRRFLGATTRDELVRPIEALCDAGRGRAVLVSADEGVVQTFRVGVRATHHVRHRNKYVVGELAEPLRFFFRACRDGACVAVAANLHEFEAIIRRCDEDVLQHHLVAGDFSRWVDGVLHDHTLAGSLVDVERSVTTGGDIARARRRILDDIATRY